MFLIIYSGQRYKIKIRKTNLRTIIFGWEKELEGQGEEGWESWKGRLGRLRSRPTRQCLVEQGPLGTDREPLGTGEDRLGTETGAGWNEGRNRWRRPASTISCPLKTHDKRGA